MRVRPEPLVRSRDATLHQRADDLRDLRAAVARDIGPVQGEHFVQLTIRIYGAHEFRFDQLTRRAHRNANSQARRLKVGHRLLLALA